MREPLHSLIRPSSYRGLLAILVFVIVVAPLLTSVRIGARALEVLFILALLSAIWDLTGIERSDRWVIGVGSVAIISRLAIALVQPPPLWLSVGALGATVALFAITIWAISRHVFRQKSVTSDTIRGAVCVYLLLGFIWTMAYVVIFAFQPAAFPALDPTGDAAGNYASLQYFSFITLTTLGYGDITPAGLIARQIAMAEAIVGQLFIAVAIAWLVGMYRREDERRGPPSDDSNDHDRS